MSNEDDMSDTESTATPDNHVAGTELRENDVVRFTPPPKSGLMAGSDRYWCVEGMAIASPRPDGKLWLVDTYWHGGGNEKTYMPEAVEYEVLFNLDDFDRLEPHQTYKWERFAPADRAYVTHQHRLQRDLYVRKGATEDPDTIIQNARDELSEAEEKLRSAQYRVDFCRRHLDGLLLDRTDRGDPR